MPRMISTSLTGYTKTQHGKSKAKTVQLFFLYHRFHYQLKETYYKPSLKGHTLEQLRRRQAASWMWENKMPWLEVKDKLSYNKSLRG